ncbi:hypothetical protein HMI56_002761 [Coelomomyces lativittatus]|nr:hypothetical protein HMI56_002761 [Coelomomyces lativittatus]
MFTLVLLVRHKKSGSLYAMKSISKSSVIAHKELDHTLAERKILSTIAQIQHPFLVQCHNAFTSERELFLVLDFVSGGDMATQLAKFGRLPPNRVQFYACEIVLGLCELHRLGIVYRDLKPENILLTPDGHVVLTDFGLSKMVSPTKNRTKTFAGTAEYLAPEILKNQEYGFEVDWWSFGTLLYEMFFGVTPFWAENQALMYKRVLEDPLLFPKFMPMDIQSLIAGLLERNPCHRLTGTLVQSHGYFKCIDWNNVYSKKIPVPYVPSLRSPMDVSNFEDVFTSMSPRLSPATHDLSASLQASFAGYSWAPSAPIHEQTQVGSSNGKSLVAVEAPSTMVTSHPPPPPSPPLPPSVSTTSTSTFTRFQKMTPSMPFINHSTLLSTSSTSPTLPQKIKSTPLPTQHSSSFAIQQCVSPLYSSFTIQEENEEMLYDQDIMIKDADEKSIQPVEEEEEEQDLLALDFTTPENEENAGSPYFDVLTSPPSTMLTPISCSTVAVSSSPSSSCITKATSPSSTISSPTLSSANYTTKGTSSPTTSSTTTTRSTPFSGVMPSTQPSPVLHHPSPYSHSPLQGPSLTLLSSQAQGPTTLTFSRSTHTKSQAMVGTTLTAKTTTFMNAPAPSHWTPQPTFLASQKYASFA